MKPLAEPAGKNSLILHPLFHGGNHFMVPSPPATIIRSGLLSYRSFYILNIVFTSSSINYDIQIFFAAN
jgi:hypothetical protein